MKNINAKLIVYNLKGVKLIECYSIKDLAKYLNIPYVNVQMSLRRAKSQNLDTFCFDALNERYVKYYPL